MTNELIDRLGGNKVLAEKLGVKATAVAQWKMPGRSIPWRWRFKVAQIAKHEKVELPDYFLENGG